MRKARTLSGRKIRDDEKEPNVNSMGMYGAVLTKTQGKVYAGSLLKNQIDKRRAKSKVAKQSRKRNRGK